jgi:glycine dehydrogenase
MLAIRKEVRDIEEGRVAYDDSPLRHAPHTLAVATADTWDRVYTRSQAAFPAPWTREHKYWPYVGRVDNAFGDRNLVCSCDAWLPAEDEKD